MCSIIKRPARDACLCMGELQAPAAPAAPAAPHFVISRRTLAREGDYEMMPVCSCVRACVRALVSHADFSKTTAATDFL